MASTCTIGDDIYFNTLYSPSSILHHDTPLPTSFAGVRSNFDPCQGSLPLEQHIIDPSQVTASFSYSYPYHYTSTVSTSFRPLPVPHHVSVRTIDWI